MQPPLAEKLSIGVHDDYSVLEICRVKSLGAICLHTRLSLQSVKYVRFLLEMQFTRASQIIW